MNVWWFASAFCSWWLWLERSALSVLDAMLIVEHVMKIDCNVSGAVDLEDHVNRVLSYYRL